MLVYDEGEDQEYQCQQKLPVPIKSWCSALEKGALEQIHHLVQLPSIFHHVVVLPDCHQGYGMPIGGVIATSDVIIPNAVGVDVGCGMIACRTSLTEIDQHNLKRVIGGSKGYKGGIRSKIPVGFSHHSKRQDWKLMPGNLVEDTSTPIVFQEYESARKQVGTLGGGNHFLEFQKGDDGYIWIMIHSGSRNLGFKVANHYNKLAIKLNEKWHTQVPKKWQLAFLPLDSKEGQLYLNEMQYCVNFALANRKLMLERTKECFFGVFPDIQFDESINIAHNYAAKENHFGKNVIVHRKGATLARKGTIGIIPGSQGTNSYIVEGLGNKESFESCSHGAGRKMSRTRAKKELDFEMERKFMNDQNIVHGLRNINDLDEAAGAYKDIEDVMRQQEDLVKIKVKLQPLAVIKG